MLEITLHTLTHLKKMMKQKPLTATFVAAVNEIVGTGRVTQAEIAKRIGIPATSLTSIIKGRRNVPVAVFDKFVKEFQAAKIAKEDSTRMIIEWLIKIEAMQTVELAAIAELLASTHHQTVSKVNADLKALVNHRVKRSLEKLG